MPDELKKPLPLEALNGNEVQDEQDSPLGERPESMKDQLSQLDELGGLQVEDMPESNELQERRRKTKNRLQELAELEDGSEENRAFADEEGGLMDLLKEANLSTRHFKFCAGILVLILLGVGLFFLGRSLWQLRQDRPQTEEPEGAEEPSEQAEEHTDEDAVFLDPSIRSGVIVGEPEKGEDDSTELGGNLGTEEGREDQLATHIQDFAQLYETMQVDVQALLNQSSDRWEILNEYQDELKYRIYSGEQHLDELREESDGLGQAFLDEEDLKQSQEGRFFEELSDLDTYASVGALDNFITHAQQVVYLRAQFNARQKLIDYYVEVLSAAQLRSTDLELNEEALVKGIQVVDIEGSDLDLIMDADEL